MQSKGAEAHAEVPHNRVTFGGSGHALIALSDFSATSGALH